MRRAYAPHSPDWIQVAEAKTYKMARYFLPQWIHVCFTAHGAVFLDIRRDRYSGLDHAKTQVLRAMLADGASADCESLAAELISAGLLASVDSEQTRPLAATVFEPPESVLVESDDEVPAINPLHVARFLASCIFVWVALDLRSLEHALLRLHRRKARLTSKGHYGEVDAAKALAGVFLTLRTFVYTASDHCLYDSLVLADFLQRYRIPSTCVFGVKTLPFGAHCWVQTGKSLTTEINLEYVAAFSPICTI